MEKQSEKKIKERILNEAKIFFLYFLYFLLFFSAFTTYKHLVLEEYGIDFFHYSYNVVEALVLAKLVLLGQYFRLGERFDKQPLIIPTFYQTLIFSLFVLVFTLLEHVLQGFIEDKDLLFIYKKIIQYSIYEILARIIVMSFVFFLFFAFLQISRIVGEEKVFHLFFGKKITRNP